MTPEDEDLLRFATIEVVDRVSRDAMRWGANPLKLWGQVSTRIIAAARTSTGAHEWSSKLMRSLRIESPSRESSRAIGELVAAVGLDSDAWLSLVEREAGYIIAAVRVRRDDRGRVCRSVHNEVNPKTKAKPKPKPKPKPKASKEDSPQGKLL